MKVKTTYPPEKVSYNEWMIHIYQQLNYPINDDGTKRETTKSPDTKNRIGEGDESIRAEKQDRQPSGTNRKGKA